MIPPFLPRGQVAFRRITEISSIRVSILRISISRKTNSNNTNRGYLSLDVRHWADANNARLLTLESMLASFKAQSGG